MAKAVDRVGQRFGGWTIVGVGRRTTGARMFLCVCDCGQRQHVAGNNLLSGQSTRCSDCQADEMCRKHDARAAAKVGTRRGTLTFTAWRRTARGLQLAWLCDCGKTGWTPRLEGPGPQCKRCSAAATFQRRAPVRHRGVGYTYVELARMIGVSRHRVMQIHRERGGRGGAAEGGAQGPPVVRGTLAKAYVLILSCRVKRSRVNDGR